MASVTGFYEFNRRVCLKCGAGAGSEADERVIGGVEDEGGDGDVWDDKSTGRASVVVVGVGEPAVAGGDLLVEFPNGADGSCFTKGVDPGIKGRFAAEAAHKVAQEVALVDAVLGFVEGVGAGGEVGGGADSDGSDEP